MLIIAYHLSAGLAARRSFPPHEPFLWPRHCLQSEHDVLLTIMLGSRAGVYMNLKCAHTHRTARLVVVCGSKAGEKRVGGFGFEHHGCKLCTVNRVCVAAP